MNRFDDELEHLLGESLSAAHQRESTTLDQHARPYGGRLVLFGAGRLGRKLLAALAGTGLRVAAFADNNRALWGTQIDGVPVLQPAEAAALHGRSAVFVVCIFAAESVGTMQDRIAELRAMGCESVISFVSALWKRPEELLPHWAVGSPTGVLKHAEDIRRCARLWSDDRSRQEFVAQIRWRLFGDFSVLPDAETTPQYFARECFSLLDDEVFVDCGAFDGDTLKVFLDESQARFQRAVCFEPDPSNFAKLSAYVESLPPAVRPRIECHQSAVGATEMEVAFAAAGDTSSRFGAGSLKVRCVPLDGILADRAATFVKLDIEGAEPDALNGARRTIANHSPVLAVCAYHTPEHVWELPLLMDRIRPGYRYFLRPYKQVWELVCYAVPQERAL